jgi:ribosomal RNA-processing protein 12
MDDLLETIVVFLEAKNREIVKSALGFVKVAVVSLPADATRTHLKRLVPALLNWVHDHKNHFKLKTVHIFERMIRKYGYDDVYKCAGEGNEKKVLEHIKKKKDRAKRQKAAKSAGDDGEEVSCLTIGFPRLLTEPIARAGTNTQTDHRLCFRRCAVRKR